MLSRAPCVSPAHSSATAPLMALIHLAHHNICTFALCRQEDAQEFLSFAMDRMHDELLKLNGNGSNSKEGMVVSSVDDDAWETVGRKNKSAIVRTQSFVPSELSAIFGGQLQSVVKAAGKFCLVLREMTQFFCKQLYIYLAISL